MTGNKREDFAPGEVQLQPQGHTKEDWKKNPLIFDIEQLQCNQ